MIMKTITEKKTIHLSEYNRPIYIVFMMTALGFWWMTNDLNSAVCYSGIALLFDPFNTRQSFGAKPLWQRFVLLAHALLVIGFVMTTLLEVFQ